MASRLLLGAWLELCMWNCGFSPHAPLHRSVGLPYSMIAELQEQMSSPQKMVEIMHFYDLALEIT